MDNLDYSVYLLAELSYKNEHPEIDERDLFPISWVSCTNYKLKAEIIAKAIKNKVFIEQVPEYVETIERVRN